MSPRLTTCLFAFTALLNFSCVGASIADSENDPTQPDVDPEPVVTPSPDVPSPEVDPDPEMDPDPEVDPQPEMTPDPSPTMEPEPSGSIRYPEGRRHSPINPFVAQHLRDLSSLGDATTAASFMKVGDSISVTHYFMHCLADPAVDFQGDAALASARDRFLETPAGQTTLFDRQSHVTLGGKTARWAVSGDPSPLDMEIDALRPAMAIVMFGTNDIGWFGEDFGRTFRDYGTHYLELVDRLIEEGIIPILSSIPPRLNKPELDLWVPAMNALIRGVAQHHQTPFLDYHLEMSAIEGFGLSRDGVHPSARCEGNALCGCVFDEEGMTYGYNLRNWIVLEALGRVAGALEGDEAPDSFESERVGGAGTAEDPIVVDALPFTDLRSTTSAGPSLIDTYPGCGASQDESGPEIFYRIDLEAAAELRFMVVDRDGVDVDVHLLRGAPGGGACAARDDVVVDGPLEAGSWFVAVDSFVSNGQALSGEFLLTVTACTPGDPDCRAF